MRPKKPDKNIKKERKKERAKITTNNISLSSMSGQSIQVHSGEGATDLTGSRQASHQEETRTTMTCIGASDFLQLGGEKEALLTICPWGGSAVCGR